ncbi:MAG: N-6 DNA methylase [Acidobacteriota bacterium]
MNRAPALRDAADQGPSPHQALGALTKSRLRGIADALDLAAPARARKAEIIETLVNSPLSFGRALQLLSRNELQVICRAVGLETSGRRKATLVDRIRRFASQLVHDHGAADPAEERQPLTLQQLESHLWESANILRGKIDSSDFKHFIFGLLFFKRLCDVWDEEYAERLRRYGDPKRAADPLEHRFHLPAHAAWSAVRQHETDIGRHLNAAFRAIEQTNLGLMGVFQDVNFDNQERFPDKTLDLLLSHFEKHRLRNADVEPDMLGNAYEVLIAQFADDAGKKGGEFYTPKQVVRLIIECLRPHEGMSIYDPACGSGGMLLEAARFLERHGEDPRTLELCGQEMNLNTWAICQMNLFLHDIDEAQVVRGDTLRHPKHVSHGKLRTFDRVLANPPFSLKNWGHDEWSQGDALGRDRYGCPPRKYGDLAFVQHMLASLEADGMLGVVVPHGILFRLGIEETIRRGLIEDDLIEAIIGLAPNLFYGTGISACVLIINRRKAAARRGKVLFVQGADERTVGKNQNHLSDANVERLVGAFHAFADEPRFARVVTLDEIRANEHNLNISRYVATTVEAEPVDMPVAIRRHKSLRAERDVAESAMMHQLADLGYEV